MLHSKIDSGQSNKELKQIQDQSAVIYGVFLLCCSMQGGSEEGREEKGSGERERENELIFYNEPTLQQGHESMHEGRSPMI